MATEWYMSYGGVEVVNHSRLTTYLETVGSPLDDFSGCGCPTFTNAVLEELPYTTPDSAASPAPWYDADVPESVEFAGLMVLQVDGPDDYPVQRTVTGGISGGGAIGAARALPRTITVTALVLGSICCSVDYGLHWLGQVLQGCGSGECDGDCLTLYSCCPGDNLDAATFNGRHRRTLRRVALVEGPRVTARAGNGCGTGECQTGADILTVEWVMTAAVPWLWTDPMPVLEVTPPMDLDGSCVEWCVHPPGECPGGCRFAECPDPTAACADPRCKPSTPPLPGAPLSTCFCLPLAAERACYEMDLTGRPTWSSDVPVITLRAGSSDLRNITIEIRSWTPSVCSRTHRQPDTAGADSMPDQPQDPVPRQKVVHDQHTGEHHGESAGSRRVQRRRTAEEHSQLQQEPQRTRCRNHGLPGPGCIVWGGEDSPQHGHDQGNGNHADIPQGTRHDSPCPEPEAHQSHQLQHEPHTERQRVKAIPGRHTRSSLRRSPSRITDRRTGSSRTTRSDIGLIRLVRAGRSATRSTS
jgi:hypothetical protein